MHTAALLTFQQVRPPASGLGIVCQRDQIKGQLILPATALAVMAVMNFCSITRLVVPGSIENHVLRKAIWRLCAKSQTWTKRRGLGDFPEHDRWLVQLD